MNTTEHIICAAIWFKDKIDHPHQPVNIHTGYVVCGKRHDNCYITVAIIANQSLQEYEFIPNEHGFLTSQNRFVNRQEAGEIAFKAGQISKETNCLISEDLY